MKVPITISIDDSILSRIETAARTNAVPRSRIFQSLINRGLIGTEGKPLVLEEIYLKKTLEQSGAQDLLATNTVALAHPSNARSEADV